MFYNNYKWSITFKKYETLCETRNLYNAANQLYFSLKNDQMVNFK